MFKGFVSATAVAGMFALVQPLHAQGIVLNFEEVSCPANGLSPQFSAYSFAGFSISAVPAITPPSTVGLGVWCPGNNSGYAGSKALFVNYIGSSITTLVRGDGSAFGITSVKLANVVNNLRGGPITFLGTAGDGTQVSQLFTLPVNSTPVLNLFTFGSDFSNLKSLQWTTGPTDPSCTSTFNTGTCIKGGNANVQLDDLTLTTVAPEPASLLLTGLGLLVLGASYRKRRIPAH